MFPPFCWLLQPAKYRIFVNSRTSYVSWLTFPGQDESRFECCQSGWRKPIKPCPHEHPPARKGAIHITDRILTTAENTHRVGSLSLADWINALSWTVCIYIYISIYTYIYIYIHISICACVSFLIQCDLIHFAYAGSIFDGYLNTFVVSGP